MDAFEIGTFEKLLRERAPKSHESCEFRDECRTVPDPGGGDGPAGAALRGRGLPRCPRSRAHPRRVPTEQLMRGGSLRRVGFVEWKKSRSRRSTSRTTGPSSAMRPTMRSYLSVRNCEGSGSRR